MKKESLFQFKDVSLDAGKLSILKGLDFQVTKGEFLAVLGASGAGKSSLLRMFNALSSPGKGTITFRGKPIDSDINSLRENVGILFQNPAVFDGSVKENLMIAGRWSHAISQLLDHELVEALKQVGMAAIELNQSAKDLSGGEQQRLALARTLLNHPQVLLLDEPTSNLDSKLSGSIMNLIDSLRKDLNLTIIAVSHDHRLMRKYAERVILLSQGQIVGDGTFKALDKKNAFELAGLEKHEVTDET